ncbi:MAG: ATP-grasp domain-containing protein [Planctomycetota bacterium]|nr:ATP-grasp domain-containing protein [Planctomycetota bacterium]
MATRKFPENLRILVLADIPQFGYRVSACLSQAGHTCHVMGTHFWSLCRVSRHCARFIPVRREDLLTLSPHLAHQIAAYCRRNRIDVVVPADLESTLFIAEHRSRLNDVTLFPISTSETLLRLHDKWTFYHLLDELGVPQPRTFLLERPEHVDDLNLAYPVVVKPRDQASSVGVWLANSAEELKRDLEYGSPRLVQEFFPGRTGSLAILADRGQIRAWTLQQRDPKGEPMTFLADPVPFRMAQLITAHTNFSGMADFDMIRDDRTGRWIMLECNPRFTATLLYKHWAGVNFPALGVRIAAKQTADWPFAPIAGECTNIGLGPRAWLRALARGQVTPLDGLPPMTRAAWRFSVGDPLPVLLQRLASKPPLARPVGAPTVAPSLAESLANPEGIKDTARARGGRPPARPRSGISSQG